jgi:hypothetical protein
MPTKENAGAADSPSTGTSEDLGTGVISLLVPVAEGMSLRTWPLNVVSAMNKTVGKLQRRWQQRLSEFESDISAPSHKPNGQSDTMPPRNG